MQLGMRLSVVLVTLGGLLLGNPAYAWTAQDVVWDGGGVSYEAGSWASAMKYKASGYCGASSSLPNSTFPTTEGIASKTFSRTYSKDIGDGDVNKNVMAYAYGDITISGAMIPFIGSGSADGGAKITPSGGGSETYGRKFHLTTTQYFTDSMIGSRTYVRELKGTGDATQTFSFTIDVKSYAAISGACSASANGYGDLAFQD